MKQVIITSIPSFYKNIAFSKLSEEASLRVFFTNSSSIKREDDFFKYSLTDGLIIRKRNFFLNVLILLREIRQSDYVVLGGWDDIYFWIVRLCVSRVKIKILVESSIYEFRPRSFSRLLKGFFIKGVNICIVSGEPQRRLVKAIGFNGAVKKSMGVGLLDFSYDPIKKQVPNVLKAVNFLYLGRVSKIKGIHLLLKAFADFPGLRLTIVGALEDEKYMDEFNKFANIDYHGYKSRLELRTVFEEHQVLLLPSEIEPWGLVVEEAIYHGLPVIVSDKVGCNEDLVKKFGTGKIFKTNDIEEFKGAILEMTNPDLYVKYCRNISKLNFKEKNRIYIESFL